MSIANTTPNPCENCGAGPGDDHRWPASLIRGRCYSPAPEYVYQIDRATKHADSFNVYLHRQGEPSIPIAYNLPRISCRRWIHLSLQRHGWPTWKLEETDRVSQILPNLRAKP